MENENNNLPKLTPEEYRAIIRDHYRQGGLKGGATMKKRGRSFFQEIGRKGAETRWKKQQENNKHENPHT